MALNHFRAQHFRARHMAQRGFAGGLLARIAEALLPIPIRLEPIITPEAHRISTGLAAALSRGALGAFNSLRR